jgi:hypothetical protein
MARFDTARAAYFERVRLRKEDPWLRKMTEF